MIHESHNGFKDLAVAHWADLPQPAEPPTRICTGCSGMEHDLDVMKLPCLNVKDAGCSSLLVKIVLRYHPNYSYYGVAEDSFERVYNPSEFEKFKVKQLQEFEELRIKSL